MDDSTILAIAGAGMVLILGYLAIGSGNGASEKRKSAIVNSGKTEKGGLFSFLKSEDNSNRRKQIEASLGDLELRTKNKEKARKSLRSKLVQADWKMTPQTFMIMSVVMGIAAAGIALFFKLSPLIIGGLGIVVGFGLPRWILGTVITRRQKKFTEHFSDAMDIIVRGVRTGLPLGDCLKIIAHESPEPVQKEFRLVVEAEGVGVPIEACLERMYDRIPLSEVKFFATVLNIQKSTGGNLGEALANLSSVLRGRKMLREKIKALAAEAKASAMIIGALPPGVMILVTVMAPEYMDELYTTKTGHRNLMIGAALMVSGTLVMRKMINFKF